MSRALIIFIKNPVLGKVKTRLAATIGDVAAMEVYKKLLSHTQKIAQLTDADKFLFYSDFLQTKDDWNNESFTKHLQKGNDLGERMHNAFGVVLPKFAKVVIIGSDCFDLTSVIIEEAFQVLEKSDLVIGPATDGGYYLLGMKQVHQPLFADINWSTNTVLPETVSKCNALHLSYALLPSLNDIDEEKDLQGKEF